MAHGFRSTSDTIVRRQRKWDHRTPLGKLLLNPLPSPTGRTPPLLARVSVLSYAVGRRTQEIGVRMALGAQRSNLLWMVVGHGMRLALMGIVVGLAGALALTRFVSAMLFEITPFDATSYAATALAMLAVAALACWVPARRAMKVDPMVALRYE